LPLSAYYAAVWNFTAAAAFISFLSEIVVEPLPYQINPRSPHFLGNKKVFAILYSPVVV